MENTRSITILVCKDQNSAQRAIIDFTPGPQGWIFVPYGECSPLPKPPGVNTLKCLEEWRGEQRISPQGITATLGDKIHP
jgi:hypothetical protein